MQSVFRNTLRFSFNLANRSAVTRFERTLSNHLKMELKGIMPPIVTNFLPDGTIDYPSMQANMEKWNKLDFSGYVLFGSNGESCLIKPQVRAEHITKIRKMLPTNKKRVLICGVNAESTEAAVDQCKMFSASGADVLLVATPSFYKANLTHKAMIEFYKEVAKASPQPILVYNVPANTGVDLPAETLLELSKLDNVIGMKDSGGDVPKLCRVAQDTLESGFQVIAGSAGFMLPAMVVGCVGCVPALGNVLGQEVVNLYQLILNQDFSKAAKLQARLVKPNAMVTRQFGVPGLKAAMEMFGWIGGPCKSPLQPLEAEQINAIRKAFIASGYEPLH